MNEIDIIYFLGILLGSFFGAFFLIPKITNIAHYKRLMSNPNQRSSHVKPISNLGGIAFFILFVLGIFFLRNYTVGDIRITIVSGLVVLLFVGLKDDLVVISPLSKLMGQLLASSFIFLDEDFINTNLYFFIENSQLNTFLSVIISAFFMLYIINAFNLIDGIDGLASTIGIVSFIAFAVLFYFLGSYFYFGLSLVGIGMLLAFLRFNLSNKETLKTFMGDTGSMIIGFMIALFTLRILSLDTNELKALPYSMENIPILIIAILIVPLFDTSRVIAIRMLEGRKPFTADKSHIHHILIQYFNLSHKKTSYLIAAINISFICLFFLLAIKFNHYNLLVLLIFLIVVFVFFFYKITKYIHKSR